MSVEDKQGAGPLVEPTVQNGLWVTVLLALAGYGIKSSTLNFYPVFWHTAVWTGFMFWLTVVAGLVYPRTLVKGIDNQRRMTASRTMNRQALSCLMYHTVLFFLYTVHLVPQGWTQDEAEFADYWWGVMDWSKEWGFRTSACQAMKGYLLGQLICHENTPLFAAHHYLCIAFHMVEPLLTGFKAAIHGALILEAGSYILCMCDLWPRSKIVHTLYMVVMPLTNFYSIPTMLYWYYANYTHSEHLNVPVVAITFVPLLGLIVWRIYSMLDPGDAYNVWKSWKIVLGRDAKVHSK